MVCEFILDLEKNSLNVNKKKMNDPESAFWLEFIIDEKMLKEELVKPLFNEATELTAIFTKSRITAHKNK